MAKYRKRPVIVEAVQWLPGVDHPGVRGANPERLCGCVMLGGPGSEPHIHTMHAGQVVLLQLGDWIITEPDGEHYYPCKSDVFEATYEREEIGR